MALVISVILAILKLCHGQGMRGSFFGSAPTMMPRGGPSSGAMSPFYPTGPTSVGSGPAYTRGPHFMGDGVPTHGMEGPVFGGSFMGPSPSSGGSSHSFGTPLTGSEGLSPFMGSEGSVPFMGGEGSTFGDSFRGPPYMMEGQSFTGGLSGMSSRGDRGFDSGSRRGSVRSGFLRSSRRFDRDRPPREGYIGARGGENAFPVHGGYCAGEMCSDGGAASGVGMGYGMGTMMAMDERRRTGRNEDIRMYEMFSGGPATSGMMGGGMGPPTMMPSPGVPLGGLVGGGGLFGGVGHRLF